MLEKLSEKLPIEAIQRTKGSETKKGYDTDGYGYQFCVNRFNEIAGEKWGFTWDIIKEVQGQYKSGVPCFEITVKISIWVNEPSNTRSCVGGHISSTYFDALKGAITNSFKKTAAFWGVGRHAYEGSIDDDNKPYPDDLHNKKVKGNYLAAKEIISVATIAELPSIEDMLEERSWSNDELKLLRGLINDRRST